MRYLYCTLLLLATFFITGCFEVVEEIRLNDDGSGQITMTVNLSQSRSKIKTIMLMDSINSYKVPSEAEIQSNFDKMVSEVQSVKGVSNVSHNTDFGDYIFTVSCDFASVDVLNDIIKHFSTLGEVRTQVDLEQFKYNKGKKTFTRSYNFDLSKEVARVNAEDRKVLKDASVTTVYKFESPISDVTNDDAKIAANKKAVMLRSSVPDLIANRKSMKNTITLNK